MMITKDDNIDIKDDDLEYKEDLEFMGVNEEQVAEASEIAIRIGEGNSKLLEIEMLADEYKATLKGMKIDHEGRKFVQVGKALVSNEFIELSYSMLYSFAGKANVLSKKNIDDFAIQYKTCWKRANSWAYQNKGIDSRNIPIVLTLFKQKLLNIGEIICDNDQNMRLVLQGIRQEVEEQAGIGGLTK